MAIECHDGFWLLKIGHDEEYSKCSPGTLLMLQTVKYAATRGLRSYEFLGTAAPWTRTWTELLRPCVAVRAYPLTLRGIGAATRDAPRLALSRLKRKLRGES
jgi:CelD/BcsL family acetyltransferase involved in cellulose biosynthesis